MYTFSKVISDVKDVSKRRRIVLVEFINGEGSTLERDMQFSIDATDVQVKQAFKSFLNELNHVPTPITDLEYTELTPETPTQAELNKQAWEADFAKLEKVKRLIDCGVLTGNETQITTLRNKVKADFKPAYL